MFFSQRMRLSHYERLIVKLIQYRVRTLPPAEALRFTFRLEAALYELEGPLAVRYNGGKHTKHRHTGYHDFFISRIKPGEYVLDVGCGMGDVANDLVEKAHAIVDGIDINSENIAEAKRRYSHPNLHFMVQDAQTLKIGKPYDAIVLSNVLEHLDNRPEFLQRITTLTKTRKVFIRVPLFERDWRVPLKKELEVEWRLDPDHKTEYTLEDFNKEIRQASLEVKHIELRWGEIWSELMAEQAK
ncbi:MAG: class I SAM-dependent methyltransferase [Anaerolineales bacterium]